MSRPFNRRRRRGDFRSAGLNHSSGHVDDWLMTYADMITLLLCFFAILLAVSVPKVEKLEQARREMMQKFAPTNTQKGRFPVQPNNQAGGEPNKLLMNLPSIVDKFPNANPAQAPEKTGDRITTIDMNSAAFFPSGNATLTDDGKEILRDVLAKLNTAQYKDFVITVEGHTDDNPIQTTQFPSNWELSTARAAAVVRYFIEQGIPPTHLRAAGYADAVPKVPNRDANGDPIPANQAQNRRVVIKLEKVDKADVPTP